MLKIRLFRIFLFFAAVSVIVVLSGAGLEYSRLAEAIRQNEVSVGSELSLKFQSGRFHRIHADTLLMDCSNCHTYESYKKDYLIVSRGRPINSIQPGRIEKAVCLGCHLPGGMGTPWYGGSR